MTYHIICNTAAFYKIGAIVIMVIMRKTLQKQFFRKLARLQIQIRVENYHFSLHFRYIHTAETT